MSEHETAMDELDRLGRQAGAALRRAVETGVTAPPSWSSNGARDDFPDELPLPGWTTSPDQSPADFNHDRDETDRTPPTTANAGPHATPGGPLRHPNRDQDDADRRPPTTATNQPATNTGPHTTPGGPPRHSNRDRDDADRTPPTTAATGLHTTPGGPPHVTTSRDQGPGLANQPTTNTGPHTTPSGPPRHSNRNWDDADRRPPTTANAGPHTTPGGADWGWGEAMEVPMITAAREERDRRKGVGPGRSWRRVGLIAAAAAVVLGGIGVVRATQGPDRPDTSSYGAGAPTAAMGDGGIYPSGARHRGTEVASNEGSNFWDWNLELPPAGHHLLLTLHNEQETPVVPGGILGNLGDTPLQVATLDANAGTGTPEVAVYGAVDARVTDAARDQGGVFVERPGADPVPLYIHPIEGATHNIFVGFVPDTWTDAAVVARTPDGAELDRTALPLPPTSVAGDDSTPVIDDNPDDTFWGARLVDGDRAAVLTVGGHEDSSTTVIDDPASHDLQVLATRLDGTPEDPVTAVYGLVTSEAASLELLAPGTQPIQLLVTPLTDGGSHSAFIGWIPGDVRDDAVVVAYDSGGREIERRPLAWTRFDAAND